MGLIVGIDRFMSEARALTDFAGNAVATVPIGTWAGEFDRARAGRVLSGADPLDEQTMLGEDPHPQAKEADSAGQAAQPEALLR